MRWPWTRDTKERESDEIRAWDLAKNLDAVIQRANRVLDKAEKVINNADKAVKDTKGGAT